MVVTVNAKQRIFSQPGGVRWLKQLHNNHQHSHQSSDTWQIATLRALLSRCNLLCGDMCCYIYCVLLCAKKIHPSAGEFGVSWLCFYFVRTINALTIIYWSCATTAVNSVCKFRQSAVCLAAAYFRWAKSSLIEKRQSVPGLYVNFCGVMMKSEDFADHQVHMWWLCCEKPPDDNRYHATMTNLFTHAHSRTVDVDYIWIDPTVIFRWLGADFGESAVLHWKRTRLSPWNVLKTLLHDSHCYSTKLAEIRSAISRSRNLQYEYGFRYRYSTAAAYHRVKKRGSSTLWTGANCPKMVAHLSSTHTLGFNCWHFEKLRRESSTSLHFRWFRKQ